MNLKHHYLKRQPHFAHSLLLLHHHQVKILFPFSTVTPFALGLNHRRCSIPLRHPDPHPLRLTLLVGLHSIWPFTCWLLKHHLTAPIGSRPRLRVPRRPPTILLHLPLLTPRSPLLLHLAKAVTRQDLPLHRQAVRCSPFVPQNLLLTPLAHPLDYLHFAIHLILGAISCNYCLMGRHPHPVKIVRDCSQAKAASAEV